MPALVHNCPRSHTTAPPSASITPHQINPVLDDPMLPFSTPTLSQYLHPTISPTTTPSSARTSPYPPPCGCPPLPLTPPPRPSILRSPSCPYPRMASSPPIHLRSPVTSTFLPPPLLPCQSTQSPPCYQTSSPTISSAHLATNQAQVRSPLPGCRVLPIFNPSPFRPPKPIQRNLPSKIPSLPRSGRCLLAPRQTSPTHRGWRTSPGA